MISMKTRQLFDGSRCTLPPPAARAMSVSMTRHLGAFFLPTSLSHQPGFCCINVTTFRLECNSVEVFRPATKGSHLVQVGTIDARGTTFLLCKPVRLDHFSRYLSFAHSSLNPAQE